MGQFNESHDLLLLGVMQYKNCRVLKINMRSPYQNSIAQGVILEDDTTRQLYTVRVKILTIFSGALDLLHHYNSNHAHILAL